MLMPTHVVNVVRLSDAEVETLLTALTALEKSVEGHGGELDRETVRVVNERCEAVRARVCDAKIALVAPARAKMQFDAMRAVLSVVSVKAGLDHKATFDLLQKAYEEVEKAAAGN